MTLSEFLSTLTTTNVTAVIKDVTSGTELISLKVSGYASLDNALESRTIAQWKIVGATQIEVLLNSTEEVSDNVE